MLNGVGKMALADWLAARHRAYCELMDQIQVFIINMMTADTVARDRKAMQRNPFQQPECPLVDIPIKLNYYIYAGTRRLPLRPLPTGTHKYTHCLHELCYVHRCVALLMIRRTMEGEAGVTWLELLVAFEAHGGKLETPVAHRLPR